jgi:hypothetical protein
MKRLSIIAVLMLATVALVSCGSGSGKSSLSKKLLMTTIRVKASADLIAVSDIEITYKGSGGADVTDTINLTQWTKKIVNHSFPTEIGIVNYRLLIKPDAKPAKDRCKLGLEVQCQSTTPFGFGMPIGSDWTEKLIDIDDIASSKVVPYLESQNAKSGLFYDGFMGFHTLTQVVSINNGHFEIKEKPINADEPNNYETSKETER